MISPQVIKEHGTWFQHVAHIPMNCCARCGYVDDPETAKKWAQDMDGDRLCPACEEFESNATMTLDRVEAAIARAFKAATTPQDELHYFNGLTIVILARKDAEDSDAMVKLDAQIERRQRQTPVSVERRKVAA